MWLERDLFSYILFIFYYLPRRDGTRIYTLGALGYTLLYMSSWLLNPYQSVNLVHHGLLRLELTNIFVNIWWHFILKCNIKYSTALCHYSSTDFRVLMEWLEIHSKWIAQNHKWLSPHEFLNANKVIRFKGYWKLMEIICEYILCVCDSSAGYRIICVIHFYA